MESMKNIVIVLGSTGFIGKNLTTELTSNQLDWFSINRDKKIKSSWGLALGSQDFRMWSPPKGSIISIVNLAGNWRGGGDEITYANHSYPTSILEWSCTLDNEVNWIQASSYFQKYIEFAGQEKNLYSFTKNLFLSDLRIRSNSGEITLFNMLLPHVTGLGEPRDRLIPLLLLSEIGNTTIQMTSGKVLVPLRGVREVVRTLVEILKNPGLFGDDFIVTPCQISTVREIAELVLKDKIGLAQFGAKPDRENEFYSLESLGYESIIPNISLEVVGEIDILRRQIMESGKI
jgi:nucleoside-diphosphate-sugar epimerase